MPCEEEKQGYPGHVLQGYPGQGAQGGRQDMYVDPTGIEAFLDQSLCFYIFIFCFVDKYITLLYKVLEFLNYSMKKDDL